MRNPIILFLLLALASCSQKRVIEYPDSETVNDFISIYRVELTDTATVVCGNAYHRPNYWVSISSGTILKGRETGKTYKLLKSLDYEIDKKVFMPESWTLPFTLVFDPLDAKDTSFDYIEDETTIVSGVNLKKKQGKYLTKISGTVIDRPNSSRLVLAPYDTDIRVNKWTSVPIIDGKFEYELITDNQTAYEIIFYDEIITGSWMPFYFFADGGSIDITCYPKDANKRFEAKATSELNNELFRFREDIAARFDYSAVREEEDALREKNLYINAETEELLQRAREDNSLYDIVNKRYETGEAYTPEGKLVNAKYDSISTLYRQYQKDYMIREDAGLSNYFYLVQRITKFRNSIDEKQAYIDIFNNIYAAKYPNHPFTEKIQLYLGSATMKQGNSFIDFTAPDLQGNELTLSDLIRDKVAIIDLWASWCGPCRRHSMELIPLYNEYKDKGFIVVGVARENNDTKAMEKAISQDGYPWTNLVELNDKNNIWQKYGAGNGGGIIIMVNREGKVIAVNPSVNEVHAKLKEYL